MKDIVKLYVLRYSIGLIVSRTITGKHKEAYIDLLTIEAIEKTIDVLRDHRGEYMPIELIVKEVAKAMGYTVRVTKGELKISYKPKGAKKSRPVDSDKFKRSVNYSLSAARELFGITELVRRPGREAPERYIAPDRKKPLTNRLNELVERINKVADYLEQEEGGYVCRNLNCNILELYKAFEAEINQYMCKGKVLQRIEYGEQDSKEAFISGCGNALEEVDVELLRDVARLLNSIIESL